MALLSGCWLAFVATTSAAPVQPITTAGLLQDMTDLAGMAEFPNPAYTCKQFSSYDRASKSPTMTITSICASRSARGARNS